MSDTGYSFGGSNGTRLKEFYEWNEQLTASRFLRGINIIGGVNTEVPVEYFMNLLESLKNISDF